MLTQDGWRTHTHILGQPTLESPNLQGTALMDSPNGQPTRDSPKGQLTMDSPQPTVVNPRQAEKHIKTARQSVSRTVRQSDSQTVRHRRTARQQKYTQSDSRNTVTVRQQKYSDTTPWVECSLAV